MPITRIVLVGLPGAGKTTIGRLLAERLGWDFVDFDREIVKRSGHVSVAKLFQTEGELAFRTMESELTLELSSRSRVVLAPGGGWAAQPGLLERLASDSGVVWLRVTPEEAIRRLRGSPEERPLLAGPDPLGAIRELARQRNHRYARADLTIDVDDRSAADIADSIEEWLTGSTSSS